MASGLERPGDLLRLEEDLRRRLGQRSAALYRILEMVREWAPDEQLALATVARLVDLRRDEQFLLDRSTGRDLIFCLGSSELVGRFLESCANAWPESFSETLALGESVITNAPAPPSYLSYPSRPAFEQALVEWRNQGLARIAILDLLKRLSVSQTISALSRLAETGIAAALEAAWATTVRSSSPAPACPLCVVAMGKLGAGELNFSSDLDLMYLFDSATASDTEIVTRTAELTTALLNAAGFRVDLRLRPGGRFAPLVVSLDGAISFYANFGQTWERAALLRARPVAGAQEVGRRLLRELEPFLFRRYLDFDTTRQLRAIKAQIEQELRDPTMIRRNIKLGRGGIREIEFIVQALTLVYGGRDPRLRTGKTLTALERLASFGYLDPARARKLGDAYLFLRDVEHKIQVVSGLQSHSLPPDPEGLRKLAARMGFGKDSAAAEAFSRALETHRAEVSAVFNEMLRQEAGAVKHASAQACEAWRHALDPELSAPALAALGFATPAESAQHLVLLARGPTHAPTSPTRREILDRLAPTLLDEINKEASPDLALANLAQFIAAVGARTSFLSLLETHAATRRVLLRLFASSKYLSTLFIRHPEQLDVLVRSDLARTHRSREELDAELAELLDASTSKEDRLDTLRSFRHQEFLRVAIADLADELSLDEVQTELTTLAECVLGQAFRLAREETANRYPLARELAMGIVAMGRLGAGEMSYNSDLDLIFVYDPAGTDSLTAHEVAAYLAQKLIGILELTTREGHVYKIDLRLRPSGNAGPLVTSVESFANYHRKHAAVWERQALVRARAVVGPLPLRNRIEAMREEFAFMPGLTANGVREIADMRLRMEREIHPETPQQLNLKQGRGGLVDVEFLAQMFALRYGGRFPDLRVRRCARSLEAAARHCLMDADDATALKAHYLFLSQLENRLRIETDRAAWAIPTHEAELTPLARRMGFTGEQAAGALLAQLRERREHARHLFEHYFAREAQHD